MRRLFVAVAALLAVAPGAALAEPEAVYEVSVLLSEDGVPVAAPSLRLATGGSARMEFAGRYRITAVLSETEDGRLTLDAEVLSPDDATWVVEARPSITLDPAGEATMRTTSRTWDGVQVTIRPAT